MAFFNILVNIGYFPSPWKAAKAIVIPKPGKSPLNPNNYRPISLLSCIGKLFERVLSTKIRNYLESNKVLNNNQSGFRNNKGTFNALFRLTETIKLGFQRKNITTAVFLDAEKAFDQTWHNGLKYKLNLIGLPHNLTSLLASFLNNRKMAISFKNCLSRTFNLKAGTPQGSVLSPLLYIIYVNDLPTCPGLNVQISQFADDIALWKTTSNKTINIKHIQKALVELERWCCIWRIKINPTKSNLIHFNRNHKKKANPSDEIILFNSIIPIVQTAKFLGIELDNKLNFNNHINNIIARTRGTIASLGNLCSNHNISINTGLNIYRSYIRPVIEYGSITFITTSKTNIKKLERIHLNALKRIIKTPRYTSSQQVLQTTNSSSIFDRLNIINKKFLQKQRHDPKIMNLIIQNHLVPPRNKVPSSVGILLREGELAGWVADWQGEWME